MDTICIAAATDDGSTISRHFGRAPHYLVLTLEDGRVVGRELRDKPGHLHSVGHSPEDPGHGHGPGHGLDPAAQDRHAQMAAVISDCQVLLVRGMGTGAYQSMLRAGIRPIVTDVEAIDEAVQAVVSGDIVDHPDRLH